MEEQETHVSEKGEISDMNELMYKIAKPITTGGGKRQSVIMTRTVPAGIDKLW